MTPVQAILIVVGGLAFCLMLPRPQPTPRPLRQAPSEGEQRYVQAVEMGRSETWMWN